MARLPTFRDPCANPSTSFRFGPPGPGAALPCLSRIPIRCQRENQRKPWASTYFRALTPNPEEAREFPIARLRPSAILVPTSTSSRFGPRGPGAALPCPSRFRVRCRHENQRKPWASTYFRAFTPNPEEARGFPMARLRSSATCATLHLFPIWTSQPKSPMLCLSKQSCSTSNLRSASSGSKGVRPKTRNLGSKP